MQAVQLNIRIDSEVKQRGDAVLEQVGITPSQAIRGLWDYLVEHQNIPEILCEKTTADGEAERAEREAAIQGGRGLALRLACESGLLAQDPSGATDANNA